MEMYFSSIPFYNRMAPFYTERGGMPPFDAQLKNHTVQISTPKGNTNQGTAGKTILRPPSMAVPNPNAKRSAPSVSSERR